MDTQGDRTNTARWTWLRRGHHPGWLWPVAVLLGFPIGGYIADLLVNGVDSVGAALAAGLIAGAIIGAAEWFALRTWVSWLCIPATTVGMAVVWGAKNRVPPANRHFRECATIGACSFHGRPDVAAAKLASAS